MTQMTSWSVLGALLLSSACLPTKNLPPPPAPKAELPSGLERLPAAPAAGFTRVVLDGDREAAIVTEELSATEASASGLNAFVSASSNTTRPVCITPCEVDFTPGLHILTFESRDHRRADRVEIQVNAHSKVIRHALGDSEPPGDGQLVGAALMVTGLSTLILGAALAASPPRDQPHARTVGLDLAIAGAGGIVLGIPISYAAAGTSQPGSTTEFPIER